jgi:hypothetical protein
MAGYGLILKGLRTFRSFRVISIVVTLEASCTEPKWSLNRNVGTKKIPFQFSTEELRKSIEKGMMA